jgi:hypothetical protein
VPDDQGILAGHSGCGMNDQQRNCALSECIRVCYERTAHNRKAVDACYVDLLVFNYFVIDGRSFVTPLYA